MNISAKSRKCGTKEVKRKGAEPEEPSALAPAAVDVNTAAAGAKPVRAQTKVAGGRNDGRKKEKESVKFAKRTFAGKGAAQIQTVGLFCVCWRGICNSCT